MIIRIYKAATVVIMLAVGVSSPTASIADGSSAQREKETSGVAPDKTNTSAGEAHREGTGEGRATPADKTPVNNDNH